MIRLDTILVAYDFSPHAEAALRSAIALARASKGKVQLLHSCGLPIGGMMPYDAAIPVDTYNSIRDAAVERLEAVRRDAAGQGVEVTAFVTTLFPVEAVLEAARKEDVGLIVVGTRGLTGLKHALLGSVAERIVRLAPCPVLTVREGTGGELPRRLLLATDFSDAGNHALRAGVDLAKRLGAQVDVVHAFDVPLEPVTRYGITIPTDIVPVARKAARAKLDAAVASVRNEGVKAEGYLDRGAGRARDRGPREGRLRRPRRDGYAWLHGPAPPAARQRRRADAPPGPLLRPHGEGRSGGVMRVAGEAELGSGEAPAAARAWPREALLTDGTVATLRPIRPDDAAALAEFNRTLSSESRYLRYFSFRRGIGDRELDRFTHPDGRLHAGVVAFVGGELVGHACFDRKDGELDAEVAFEVADAFQGRGLGTLLLETLVRQARGEGIHTFTARVLPQNRKSLQVFRDLGLQERTCFEEGCVLVALDLAPTPASRAAERHRHARARRRGPATGRRASAAREGIAMYEFLDYVVSDAMTREPVCVAPGASLASVEQLLEQHGWNALPVVEDGRLVGLVTSLDLLKAFRFTRDEPLPAVRADHDPPGPGDHERERRDRRAANAASARAREDGADAQQEPSGDRGRRARRDPHARRRDARVAARGRR